MRVIRTTRTHPTLLPLWLRLTSLPAPTPHGPCLLDPTLLPLLPLPPALLALLPALAHTETWEDAAQQMPVSPQHIRRLSAMVRDTLALPPYRMHPRGFAQQVLAALAAPASVWPVRYGEPGLADDGFSRIIEGN